MKIAITICSFLISSFAYSQSDSTFYIYDCPCPKYETTWNTVDGQSRLSIKFTMGDRNQIAQCYIFSEYHYEGGSPNIEYGIIDFESKNDTLKLFWKETDFHFSPDIFDSGWFPKVLLIKKKKLIPVVNNNLVKYMKFKLVK